MNVIRKDIQSTGENEKVLTDVNIKISICAVLVFFCFISLLILFSTYILHMSLIKNITTDLVQETPKIYELFTDVGNFKQFVHLTVYKLNQYNDQLEETTLNLVSFIDSWSFNSLKKLKLRTLFTLPFILNRLIPGIPIRLWNLIKIIQRVVKIIHKDTLHSIFIYSVFLIMLIFILYHSRFIFSLLN